MNEQRAFRGFGSSQGKRRRFRTSRFFSSASASVLSPPCCSPPIPVARPANVCVGAMKMPATCSVTSADRPAMLGKKAPTGPMIPASASASA